MKRAVVLCGGGSRGAYQIGVMDALHTLDIPYHIITGTSIGSVNGALFVQNDFDLARKLWDTITTSQIMENGLDFNPNLEYYVENRSAIMPFLKTYIAGKGADITPFKNLLSGFLDEDKFFASPIDFGLMTVRFPSLQPCEILKKNIKRGCLQQWILASTACFPAFPLCEIDGAHYIDGGYYDNLPIDTAVRLGAEEVIAVSLKPDTYRKKHTANPLVTYIEPSRALGAFLSFDHISIQNNITLGYFDTMKTLGSYRGCAYTFSECAEANYMPCATKVLHQIMQIDSMKNPAQRRVSELLSKSDQLMTCIRTYSDNASDVFGCFLGAVELFMELFSYDIYTAHRLEKVLSDVAPRCADPKNEDAIQITAAARTLRKNITLTTLIKTYSDKHILCALLLNALTA